MDKKKWIAAIPRANLIVSKYTAVCRKHWPQNATFVLVYGRHRPKDAPPVFPDIPASCLRSARKSIPRTTKRSLSSGRKHAEDEMKIFIEQIGFWKNYRSSPKKV